MNTNKDTVRKFFLIFNFALLVYNISYARINIDSASLNILEKGDVSEFMGNVRIISDNFTVTAQRAVSRKRAGVIEAYGNVHINYSSSTWNVEGWCGELKVFSSEDRLVMKGNAKTVYSSDETVEEEKAEIYADMITFIYSEDRKIFFDGNVQAQNSQLTVFSNKAQYLRNKEIIEFSQSPRALSLTEGITTEYWGDLISLLMDDKKVKISGNARTKVKFKDEFKM